MLKIETKTVEKYCSSCKQTKPVSEFYRRRNRPSGYVSKCKECRNFYHAEYLKTQKGKEAGKNAAQRYWQKYAEKWRQDPEWKARVNATNRKYRQTAKGRRSQRNFILLRKYGITLEQYEQLFERQGKRCLICGSENPVSGFHVDHCHRSNKVRGILCHHCNSGLGLFNDDPNLFLKAAEYLVTHNQLAIPSGVMA